MPDTPINIVDTVSVTSSALPTNAAQETGGNLASIATATARIPAQGQAVAGASTPVVLPAAQEAALTPPTTAGAPLAARLSDGSAFIGHAAAPVRTDPTGSTTQPVSGSVSISGTATVSGTVAVSSLPGSPAQEHTTAASPSAVRLSDGSAFIGTSGAPLRTDPTGTTTQPVSAAALPLPSGAATAANQATEIASLSSIDGKTATLVSGRVPVDGSGVTQPISAASLPLPTGAATESTLSTLNSKVTACNTGAVVVSSSALPSGAATAARQDTGNTSLASIDGKLPALAWVAEAVCRRRDDLDQDMEAARRERRYGHRAARQPGEARSSNMSAGFFARAGIFLGRGIASLGLDVFTGATVPVPTGATRLPTQVRLLSPSRRNVLLLSQERHGAHLLSPAQRGVLLLSPARRLARRLSPAFRKVQVFRV